MGKKIKITVLKANYYQELAEEYAISDLGTCPFHHQGQVLYSDGINPPDGMCGVAWQWLAPFVHQLSEGELLQPSGTWLKDDTVGREFGSGGRELGRRLSETLGYAYYDQEIVAEIAKRTELSEQYVREIEEHHTLFSYPIHIGRTLSMGANSIVEQHAKIYGEQSRILKEMAAKSDCVIVGRCADVVLADQEPFRIFVYADLESKLARCQAKAPENEQLTDRELKQKISAVDKGRAKYYAFLTGRDWGNKLNFDLCVNTTKLVIKEIVPVLSKLFV